MQTDAGDFLLWSECVARLMEGMYGSFKQPEQVREARDLVPSQILDPKLTLADSRKLARNLRLASMNFGPRKQEAGKALRMAALKGAFPVYIKLPAKKPADRPQNPYLSHRVYWRA